MLTTCGCNEGNLGERLNWVKKMLKGILKTLFLVVSAIFLLVGCKNGEEILSQTSAPHPTSIDQVAQYLDGNTSEKIEGTWAALEYPEEYKFLIPLITHNIYEEPNLSVQIAIVKVLGQMGVQAEVAVPDLIWLLENEKNYQIQENTLFALGQTQNKKAVPYLAEYLYVENEILSGISAKSIAKITGLEFQDSNKEGLIITDAGISTVAMDARQWWEETGQYINWDAEGESFILKDSQ